MIEFKSFRDSVGRRSRFFGYSFVATIFLLVLLLGVQLHKDFGISHDELVERHRGLITMKYVGEKLNLDWLNQSAALNSEKNLPNLEQYQDGDHGPVFDIIAVGLEIVLNITDDQKIFQFRHLLTFIIFWFGLISIFLIADRRFSDWRIGLLAVTGILLSPRIFAEAFYNSKDIVFLSFFSIAMYFAISFILKPNWRAAVVLGFVSALATDVRLLGMLIPIGTIIALCIPVATRHKSFKFLVVPVLYYLLSFFVFAIIFWPWLWHDPLGQFMSAFGNLSNFPVQPPTLYFGKAILLRGIPWHYIPVWILITTPIIYLIFAGIGISRYAYQMVVTPGSIFKWKLSAQEMQDLVFLGFFLGPILIVIVLKSTLYDGWRHLYFIYPSFVMLALRGFTDLFRYFYTNKLKRVAFTLICCSVMLGNAFWMVRYHPFQNVYFNIFAGHERARRFDIDYWGLSGRTALEMILKNDSRHLIRVFPDGLLNIVAHTKMLDPEYRNRFEITESLDSADYVITTYRDASLDDDAFFKYFSPYLTIDVDKESILSIYRRSN